MTVLTTERPRYVRKIRAQIDQDLGKTDICSVLNIFGIIMSIKFKNALFKAFF